MSKRVDIEYKDSYRTTDLKKQESRDQFPMANSLPDTIDELIALLETDAELSDELRIQAITMLGNLLLDKKGDLAGVRAISCLVSRVKTERNPRILSHCISVLGRVKALGAVMVIIDIAMGTGITLLNEADAGFLETDECLRLRCTAVQALGQLRDERSVIPLMSILNDKAANYRLRMKAAESLGKAGDTHALGSLMEILEDEREKSVYLKESTAKALGMLGDIRAMDALLNVLESKQGIRDKFDFLKERAIESISRLMGEGNENSDKVTESLLRALKDEASSIRLAAVEAIGEFDEDEFIEPLKAMVRDSADDVAIAAIHAVFRLGGETAIRDLLTLDNLPQFLRDEMESYIP